MKKSKKILAVLLAVLTVIGIFSCATTVWAEEYNEYVETKAYEEKLLTETVDSESEKAEIVCEVEEKREEYSKTYKRADGSYTTVVSQTPIHTLKDGEWKEIDNSLKTEGEILKNTDGSFDIEFPETISENEKITVTNNGESIAFSVNNIDSSSATVTTLETDGKNIIEDDLSRTVSEITYESIDENTDVQYVVSSGFVKENIIVNDKSGLKETYSFDIEKGNLTAVLDDSNNLIFKNDKKEIEFTVPAPVMTDANNAVSYDIDVEVRNITSTRIELIYKPSADWLNSFERAFPIIIDPVIMIADADDEIIQDTSIQMKKSDLECEEKNFSDGAFGSVMNTEDEKTEVLVKLSDSFLNLYKKHNVVVTDARYCVDGQAFGDNILVKGINGTWEPSTITYRDVYPEENSNVQPVITYDVQPTDFHTCLELSKANDAENYTLCFNITKLFNQWLHGERNNDGFALLPSNESTMAIFFMGGKISYGTNSHKFYSYCSIDYVETNGYNSDREYTTQTIGRAGTVNIDNFSRNFTLARNDLSINGNIMPITTGFNYNSAVYSYLDILLNSIQGETPLTSVYGNRWYSNYTRYLFNFYENDEFLYFTETGSVVEFKLTTETVTEETKNEDGTTTSAEVKKTVFEVKEGSEQGYSLELVDENEGVSFSNLKLTTPTGLSEYFIGDDAIGCVTKIQSSEKNPDGEYDEINIAYYGDDIFVIDYITDGVGRKYDFDYNEEIGLLSSIKCYSADGTSIKAGSTNNNLSVSYGYDENRNLTSVTYPDGKSITYTYDTNGNLTNVKNVDNYNIQYTYDTLNKVTGVQEKSMDEESNIVNGNNITLTSLSDNQVKIADNYYGTYTYQFDKVGSLLYTFDDKGNYLKSENFNLESDDLITGSEWQISSTNLLKNPGFEVKSGLGETTAKHWSNEFTRTADSSNESEEKPTFFRNFNYNISSNTNIDDYVEQTIDADGNIPYTFSAYIKNTSEDLSGSLSLRINLTNSSNVVKTVKQSFAGSSEWTRVSVTYEPTSDFIPEEITAGIGFDNNKGSFAVDCVQLEKGKGVAEYNIVENGSFNLKTSGSAVAWTNNNTTVAETLNGYPISAIKLSAGLPYYTENDDETYTLNDTTSSVSQEIDIDGKKDDIYSLGGWFKGYFNNSTNTPNIPTSYGSHVDALTCSNAQLKVTYSYVGDVTETAEDGSETIVQKPIDECFAVAFQPGIENWQFATDSFKLKGDTDKVYVSIITKNIPTDSYATNIELVKDTSSVDLGNLNKILPEDTEETETTPCVCGCEWCETGEGCTCTGAVDDECTCADCVGCQCEDCEEIDCACRCESEENCTCVQCKRTTYEETVSTDGTTITTKSYDGYEYLESSIEYSNNLDYIIRETDENNISSSYTYTGDGTVASVLDGTGEATIYQSNPMGYLALAKQTNGTTEMAINYAYDGDTLTSVTQGNVEYTYTYDPWGQVSEVAVDEIPLIAYEYDTGAKRSELLSVQNNNVAFEVEYLYNTYGEIYQVKTTKTVDDEPLTITYDYRYDNLGNLTKIVDNVTGRTISYTEDGVVITKTQGGQVIYQSSTDENGNLIETANGVTLTTKTYDSDYNQSMGITTQKSAVISSNGKKIGVQTQSDYFGRNKTSVVMTKDPTDAEATNFAQIQSDYFYKLSGGNKTTNLVSNIFNTITGSAGTTSANLSYTYDSNGRISSIMSNSSLTELNQTSQYTYDEAGQLIREVNGNSIVDYTYDSKGNILSRIKRVGTQTTTDTFTYGANSWEDKLTKYNNQDIVYDAIGNPTSYLGATLTWRGRALESYSDSTKNILYSYDVDGMRYQKIVRNGNTETARYDYVYSDGKLIVLTYTANGTTNTARFVYDYWGEVRGFILNDNATYLYLKNIQGDIVAIVDEAGSAIVTYSYDAWGNFIYDVPNEANSHLVDSLLLVSPFTYRGYCYDYDIGMYYLQSRYYDPDICRFINADSTDYLGATGTLFSYNLFAYCENDGINYADATGTWAKDVHYSDTKTWAKYVGYNSTESKTIAEADQGMDNIKNHAMFIWNQHIHFNTNVNKGIDSRMVYAMTMLTLACVIWDNSYSTYLEEIRKAEENYSGYKLSKKKRDLFVDLNNNKGYCIQMVGQGLHAIQDIEGHGQTEPTIEVFGITLTQHLVSSGGKKKHKSDNTWYSWKNNKKTHLYFDISRERYYDTKDDSLFYLRSFFDFRNELYKQKYKEYFSKKEYQFNGFCM